MGNSLHGGLVMFISMLFLDTTCICDSLFDLIKCIWDGGTAICDCYLLALFFSYFIWMFIWVWVGVNCICYSGRCWLRAVYFIAFLAVYEDGLRIQYMLQVQTEYCAMHLGYPDDN
ncbi:hypothetical protein BDV25DRAFT_75523 [Aspergillus avenaceus]|uniref:Uncharacterized protein n=1 Tax=Aspergillus avenaceus TaxID=36643 RepID=A0A5N6TGI3_ASPAV|nr:hypothetical protein BDV25DRAFT_75523 [Aspergillus avenaceus]